MRALVLLAASGVLAFCFASGGTAAVDGLPPIVFVSRHPIPSEPHAVPGLGPNQRAVATGGRLLVRETDGRLREIETGLFDVADPAVAWDGRRLAFAGTPHADSGWRIFLVGTGGGAVRPVTRRAPPVAGARLGVAPARIDDLDPCWIGPDEICFASTRYPLRSTYADVPVTNLYVTSAGAGGAWSAPARITSERNGAEEPSYDAARDRVVFARWWFNRHRASASGITTEARGALLPDSVNFWQAISIPPHGGVPRLAAGESGSRRGTMAYQPALKRDGGVIGVFALNLGLSPRPGPLGIQRLPRGAGRSRRLAGAVIPETAPSGYADALGVAAPGACAPAVLPDERIVFSYSPGGRGDYGLYLTSGSGNDAPRPLVDLPGTLELDAAPIVARPASVLSTRRDPPVALSDRPASVLDSLGAHGTFTYRSLGLFGSRGPALRRVPGARIRFYAAPLVLGPGERDTAILVREVPVRRDGSVEEPGLPADVPLFEQVVDSAGRVLRSAHGAAHVAGFNAGRPGEVSRCVGCHFGHSKKEPAPGRR